MDVYQIKIANLVENNYGQNDIVVSMVSKYKDSKFVKHLKLNAETLEILLKGKIYVIPEQDTFEFLSEDKD